MQPKLALSPALQTAADRLSKGIMAGGILALQGKAGSGKTAILQHLRGLHGGILIGMRDFLRSPAGDRYALAEAFLGPLDAAIHAHDLVLVDDLHLLANTADRHSYTRRYLIDAALTSMLAEAGAMSKSLVFASRNTLPWPIARRISASWRLGGYAGGARLGRRARSYEPAINRAG